MDDDKPSPEAFLAAAKAEHPHGRLKVFLGACPGVGKTYAMLEEARARAEENADVVAAVIETHGRSETASLLIGLELLPRRKIPYKGHQLEEMDLDALLARRPHFALVDELAHANAPGSRHPKRYLDVEEVLAAGINVYTTLNIQHIESLHDAVARITGVRVQERVPDSIIDRADEIEMVDVSVEELLERLREGKVYVPDRAAVAIERFFRPENISALRELALRRAAERAGVETSSRMRARSIRGPWPTAERLVVCVGPSPLSARLVRETKRRASARRAPWTAVHIETPETVRLADDARARLAGNLKLAEELGGETATIPGDDAAEALVRYARERNATEIVIGKTGQSRFMEMIFSSLTSRVVRLSGEIDVLVVQGEEESAPYSPTAFITGTHRRYQPFGLAILRVVGAGVVAKMFEPILPLPSLSLVFLAGVLFSAVKDGLWPSVAASGLSFLVYNFFFIPPHFTLTVASPVELGNLIAFLMVAILTSHLAGRARDSARLSEARAARERVLHETALAVASARDRATIAEEISGRISGLMTGNVAFLIESGGKLESVGGVKVDMSAEETAAAQWTIAQGKPSGMGTDTFTGLDWLFVPLLSGARCQGALGIHKGAGSIADAGVRSLVESLAGIAAVGLERAQYARIAEETAVAMRTERLRNALFESISHDLRSPLTAIIGSVSSLLDYPDRYDVMAQRDLLATIREESERLGQYLGNLLDMMRLQSGMPAPRLEWCDLVDIVGSALERLRRRIGAREVKTIYEGRLPLVRVDFSLMEQVIVNLVDNALRYSAAPSPVTVGARMIGEQLEISVSDEGPGIPADEREKVFDKFHRVRRSKEDGGGIGLGLSICRGFVEAHGGKIRCESPAPGNSRGASFIVDLAIEKQPAVSIDGKESA